MRILMNGGFPGAGSLSLLPRGWDKKFARATQEPHLYCTILPHWCTLVQEPHWCHTCTTQECTLVQEPHSPQKLVSPALLTSHNIVLTHAKKHKIMTKIIFGGNRFRNAHQCQHFAASQFSGLYLSHIKILFVGSRRVIQGLA